MIKYFCDRCNHEITKELRHKIKYPIYPENSKFCSKREIEAELCDHCYNRFLCFIGEFALEGEK